MKERWKDINKQGEKDKGKEKAIEMREKQYIDFHTEETN